LFYYYFRFQIVHVKLWAWCRCFMSCVVVLVALNLWPVLISPRDSGWGPGAQLIDSTYQFSSERIREPSNDSLQLRLNIVKPELN